MTIACDAQGVPLLGAEPHDRQAYDIWKKDVVIGWVLDGRFIARKDMPPGLSPSGGVRWGDRDSVWPAGNRVTVLRDGAAVAERVADPSVINPRHLLDLSLTMGVLPGDTVRLTHEHTISGAIDGEWVWTGADFEPADARARQNTKEARLLVI